MAGYNFAFETKNNFVVENLSHELRQFRLLHERVGENLESENNEAMMTISQTEITNSNQ